MLDCDLAVLEGYVLTEPVSIPVAEAFGRIKTALAEAQKTPTNKQSEPFDVQPCCEGNEWLCSVCGKSARFY